MGHKCTICKTTDEKAFFHAFGDNEVCEDCAAEHGCTCGCFPSPIQIKVAKALEWVGYWEKDNNDKWQFIRD